MNLIESIALIGIYPPPFGGVSIHIKILSEELSNRNMIKVLITGGKGSDDDPSYLKRISDIRILNKNIFWHYKIPFITRLYSKNIKVIHSHEGLCSVPFLFFHRFFFKKNIIHTIHNQWVKERYNQLNFFSKVITKIFLRDKNTFWICVNENAYNQMLELGVKKEAISIIPAYIPNSKNTITSKSDLKIIQTIKEFKKDSTLIGVYGFRFYFDANNRDIYGFNFSIDVFKKLLLIKPFIKLIILIPSASPIDYKEKLKLRIHNEGLSTYVLTIFDNPIINMNLFWTQLDIYFRPTTDDGDSLAIREAIANGVSTVASDVCNRPKQTKIFKSLNIDNALSNLLEAIDDKQIPEDDDENYLHKLLLVYANKS